MSKADEMFANMFLSDHTAMKVVSEIDAENEKRASQRISSRPLPVATRVPDSYVTDDGNRDDNEQGPPRRETSAPTAGNNKMPTASGLSIVLQRLVAAKKEKPSEPAVAEVKKEEENKKPFINKNVVKMSSDKMDRVINACGLVRSMLSEDNVFIQAVNEKIASVGAEADEFAYLSRSDVHPMALFSMLGQRYGDEWLDWELEVIKSTVTDDTGQEPSDDVMNKVASIKIVINDIDRIKSDWHVFEKVAVAMNGRAPRMVLIEDLSPEQMAFAASVIRMIEGQAKTAYSHDMEVYCAARLFDSGMVMAPSELGFCDKELVKLCPDSEGIRKEAIDYYGRTLNGDDLAGVDQESAGFIQTSRLMRVHAYVLDKTDDLIRQTF